VSGIPHRGTLLDIPLIEERYGRSVLASFGIHAALFLFIWLGPYLFPSISPVRIGTGPGGGLGGETYAVGVIDDLGGGAGMIKPSVTPQPPALPQEKQIKPEPKEAVALPDTIAPKKKPQRAEDTQAGKKKVQPQNSNVIPTEPRPGAGGTGGLAGGSGGGRGGGVGVSIGAGSGGEGDSWYARVVESRISSNWIRPAPGIRVEIVYSFFIASNGSIYDITKEKASGNDALDLAAERAIRTSNPLSAPPPEMRARPMQFVAQFIYPPNP
jgi:TonB family protein